MIFLRLSYEILFGSIWENSSPAPYETLLFHCSNYVHENSFFTRRFVSWFVQLVHV